MNQIARIFGSRPLLLSASVFLAGTITSCGRTSGAAMPAAVVDLPTVAVVQAARADLSSSLNLTAEFEPFQEVDVMAKVSGYIREINVDIGDRVREGQVLATLEIPEMQDDVSRAAAAIEEATAELATARDELQRMESAHDMAHLSYTRILDVSKREPGLVPQQEVDEAHSRDLVAEAQVSSAKSHIAVCEQRIRVSEAEQAHVKTLYKYAVIAAPFAGVVTKRYANRGSLIQAGTASPIAGHAGRTLFGKRAASVGAAGARIRRSADSSGEFGGREGFRNASNIPGPGSSLCRQDRFLHADDEDGGRCS